jgi:DNA-binding helix-hairpin-helix protein with protein kinase domain
MRRRRREIRAFEPLLAIDLRGDVLEREISHFHWQTTKDLGHSPMPSLSSFSMAGLEPDVKDFFSSGFLARARKLLRPCLFVPAWLGTELRRM